ncbi:bifunctional metallophosphatase/5'-nucleotidase [Planococcus salinus]|uniref:Bifunctional metallophosphatase/5'-nucleotidase n=1 Tax=Planococcus salinus TaxID=1848460 RepID=A0A3M8PAA2_9BACL|nr:bifunctional metallophosphatase/5'-nucleotidase [Planococcus salinus]
MKNKKFIASAVTATAIAAAVSPASADFVFTDVTEKYEEAVQFLLENGITNGVSDTQYGTHQSIKRQDAAIMIARTLGFDPDGEYEDSGFTDVPSHAKWAVDALKESGVIDGVSATQFDSNSYLTRNQTAKVLANAAGLVVDETVTTTKYSDVNAAFAPYVDALIDSGITQGKTETSFGAYQNTTRGEMALFIERAKDYFFAEVSFEMSIMHANDTHARVENLPKQVTAINDFRTENPDSLLLHAGDVFSGTLYFNEFEGEADIKLMNLMNFDAMTFGNHEFDLGSSPEGHQALRDFVTAANFPFVSSNVDFSADDLFEGLFQTQISSEPEGGNIYTGIVKEVNGEQVGIFGLTTKDTEDISSPGLITFSDNYIAEAQRMVDEFAAMGVDKVVALTHIGYNDNPAVDNDLELAAGVEGIDVIVGGHTHTSLEEPYLAGDNSAPTVIVQAGEYGNSLGTLDVGFDENGVVVSYDGGLIEIGEQAEDPEAVEILAPYKEQVEAVQQAETGAVALAPLENPRAGDDLTAPSVRKNETPLGNIITDGMLNKAREYSPDAIMAFQNGGGIREAIDEGPITVGEVISVLPFGNTLATMELTGAEIKEAFEISVGNYPNENGGFLHVSGGQVRFDSSQPAGERVVSVSYEEEDGTFTELEDAETYTIATNAFTAKGGDGYDVFADAYAEGRVTDLGLSDWENFQEELVRLGEITPETEGRIVNINEETVVEGE